MVVGQVGLDTDIQPVAINAVYWTITIHKKQGKKTLTALEELFSFLKQDTLGHMPTNDQALCPEWCNSEPNSFMHNSKSMYK